MHRNLVRHVGKHDGTEAKTIIPTATEVSDVNILRLEKELQAVYNDVTILRTEKELQAVYSDVNIL